MATFVTVTTALKLMRLARLIRLPRMVPIFQQRLDMNPSFARLMVPKIGAFTPEIDLVLRRAFQK